MFNQFTKKPFKDRLKDTGYLIKHSFKVIGKDKDIIKPTIHMAVFSIVLTTLFFISLFLLFTGKFVILSILMLLILFFVLNPFKFFYNIRQKADQSWIVYNTICGKDISYNDAHNYTQSQKSNLRKIAFIEILITYLSSQKNEKKGILAGLANLFLASLSEIWDLLSHYMIPAVVVEQKSLNEIVPQIKSLKENVPATLTGVFGIDFAGSVVRGILFKLYLLIIIIGSGIGHLFITALPNTVLNLGGFSFSWVPVLILLYIGMILGTVTNKIVESVKVIYFTIFYLSIRAPTHIDKSIRAELTHYLNLGA